MILDPISKLLWEDLAERMHLFDPARIVSLHQEIYAALRRRDRDVAVLAMRNHLDVGYETFFGESVRGEPHASRRKSAEA